jgi:Zn-dependent protease with chaperone function
MIFFLQTYPGAHLLHEVLDKDQMSTFVAALVACLDVPARSLYAAQVLDFIMQVSEREHVGVLFLFLFLFLFVCLFVYFLFI